jgi:hypothetical protein
MGRTRNYGYGYESETEQEDFIGDLLSGVLGSAASGLLSEVEEEQYAGDLLEINSEDELEEFLGDLFGKAVKGISNFAKSDVGQALGQAVKTMAKKSLPAIGGALGSYVAPGIGTSVGTQLGTMASGLIGELPFEVEPQAIDHEVAKRIVRIGAEAARQASRMGSSGEPPTSVASKAIVNAVNKIAPATLVQAGMRPRRQRHFAEMEIDRQVPTSRREGRWHRRGRNIVLLDV